jgi:hypothetical protein
MNKIRLFRSLVDLDLRLSSNKEDNMIKCALFIMASISIVFPQAVSEIKTPFILKNGSINSNAYYKSGIVSPSGKWVLGVKEGTGEISVRIDTVAIWKFGKLENVNVYTDKNPILYYSFPQWVGEQGIYLQRWELETAASDDYKELYIDVSGITNPPTPFLKKESTQNQNVIVNKLSRYEFNLPKTGPTSIAIKRLSGEVVIELKCASCTSLVWDGQDNGRSDVSSGTYVYSINQNRVMYSGKLDVLK